jgi:hypothetical protein
LESATAKVVKRMIQKNIFNWKNIY